MPVKRASAGSHQSKQSLGARSLRVALAAASLGAFGFVFAHAYIEGTGDAGGRVVPLLRADTSPIKTRPIEPGGLRVPDRDKKIYQRLRRANRTRKSKPIARLILRPGVLKPIAEPKAAADRRISGRSARGIASVERRSAKTQKIRARASSFRVQIAAFAKPEQATRRWRRLAVRHKDLVGKLKWYVEKVERGSAKGPLYRLQLGPLRNRKSARELCAELGRRKITCFGVKG
ncbi:MAG: SPOR domain-containing protein [Alphaproteobacteria bacterium]